VIRVYRSFKVKNFRCFDDLEIAPLERVNLIAGMNDVGKTALLEALFLHCGAWNVELTYRLNLFRGMEPRKIELSKRSETPWDSLFKDFDPSKVIELTAEEVIDEGGARCRSLRLSSVQSPSEFPRIEQLIEKDSGEPVIPEIALSSLT